MTQERLQKILAARGVASRRHAEEMITAGRIAINGQTVTTLGVQADVNQDKITVDGEILPAEPAKRYLLLYKPAGYITSLSDPQGRRTILDLLPGSERVYPVGRLDYNTSGLLLLTNDGTLTNALLHPSGEINKVYRATIPQKPSPADLEKLRHGLLLSDGMTAPAKVRLLDNTKNGTVIEITIHEGRNRQVRRMLAALGHEVICLKRVAFAGLNLAGLKPGQWRELTKEEIAKLYRKTINK